MTAPDPETEKSTAIVDRTGAAEFKVSVGASDGQQ